MFSNNSTGFGGFGQANNNNNNNQPNQTSFGGFGNNANTSTPVFGQAAQNNMGNSTFGGFGTTNNAQQNSTPSFGSFGQTPQQNTTSFGFGASSNTSTPAFGGTSSSVFNQPSSMTATPAFGAQSTPSLFGSTQASGTFGNPLFGGNNNAGGNTLTSVNGTANPPFAVQIDKEAGGSGINHFQSISCMPAYAGSSHEELRFQDYNQNRRYGNGPSNTFGSTPFTSSSNNQSVFGAPAQSSPFGASNTTSTFGQLNNGSQSSGGFGANTTPQQGGFGQNSGQANLFPSTNGGQSNSGTTGNPFSAINSTNVFGTTPSTNPPNAFGVSNSTFNVPQANASNPFGASNNAFGQNNTAAAKPFTFGGNSGSIFGQNNTTQQNPTTNTTPFGQAAGSNMSSANNGSTPFGSNSQNNQGGGFSFGASNTATPTAGLGSGFGFGAANNNNNNSNTAATTNPKPFSFGTPATGTTGNFGSLQNNSAPKPFTFGSSNTATQPASTTNLFGPTPGLGSTPSTTTNMFGGGNNNSLSGGAFSGNQSATQASTNNNPFGKPFSGSIFGNNNGAAQTQGSFGSTMNQGSTLNFGSNTSTAANNGQNSGGMFGQSQQQVAPQLQQSINSSPYGMNPLFSSVQGQNGANTSPGPIATPLVSTPLKKKPAMLPHFKAVSSTPIMSPKAAFTKKAAQPLFSGANASHKPQFTLFDEELLLQPDAFSPRTNIKRLVIDRKPSDMELLSGSVDLSAKQKGPPRPGEHTHVQIDTDKPTSHEAKDLEQRKVPSSNGDAQESANKEKPVSKPATVESSQEPKSVEAPVATSMTSGSYWTSPPVSTLLDMSKAQLSKVKNFQVGRTGYGQVSFIAPVDLSSFEAIEDIAGNIIVFESKMCIVYPEENLKPAVGKGLNVPAIITLENCYPLSRDKRKPIRDTEHQRFQQHVDRLKRMSETTFIDYLADSGTWIFQVQHF